MFGLFRSKDDTKHKAVQAKLHEAALKIISALNTDIDYLLFFAGKQKSDFLDAYFVRYLFGMFDAVTFFMVSPELRLKIGKKFIAAYYLAYLIQEFGLEQAQALRAFHSVWRFYNTDEGERDDAIGDGGTDGLGILRGQNPQRLMKHFGVSADDGAQLMRGELEKTNAQLPKWAAFCSRDRWSDNAIREGQRVMQAVIDGVIALD
jgi:hypothetical protein